ncbi:unnamed protein product, partial [Discosporangium mesarthrocarpum]
ASTHPPPPPPTCWHQVDEADLSKQVDPRVQTGNRDKRAKRAFNFVEQGTYVKMVCSCWG